MKVTFSIIAIVIFSCSIKAQSPSVQWVEQFGDIGEEYAFCIDVDDSANTFVTGLIGPGDSAFHNRVQNNNHVQCVDHDIFVARYNRDGLIQWLYKIGAAGTDEGWGVSIDKNHNVCSVSTFQDTLHLNNDTLISNGFIDILITKFSAQGVLLWAKRAGGILGDYGYAIANDSQNNIYITGSFYGQAQFGDTLLNSSNDNNVFLAKYDVLGNLIWAINAGGSPTYGDEGYAITIDKSDNIYVTGKFGGTAIFSSDTLVSRGSSDIFVAKYNTLGVLQWIRQGGGAGIDRGQGIKTDRAGNLLVTGYFNGAAIFNADTLFSQGSSDVFISKYDAQGNAIWTKSAGGSGTDEGAAINADSYNKIYVAGYFANNASFGTSVITSSGSYDAYLACLDSAGNFEWIKKGGGIGMDAASSVCVDSSNAVYFAGSFNYVASFDSVSVNSVGDANFFVTKIGNETPSLIQNYKDDKINLMVFPNPSGGPVSLILNESRAAYPLKVKIINSIGQPVYENELNGAVNQSKIDLTHLDKGIYFIEATLKGNLIRKKIILE